jgi:exopolyphosphatase / guanosine-5'-triphosphate,3'-diphosphate pyrophosphatase
MHMSRRAVIDVGTNSVKLLVADVQDQTVSPVWEEGIQTRLGEGFYETHRLQAHAIERTAASIAHFAALARTHGATCTRLIATSAARDAINRQELLETVRQRCGLDLEVISGHLEAEWAYLGVLTNPAFAGQRLLIVDAGGGSTELILGEGDRRIVQCSLPIGAVRLLEKFRPSDPPGRSELQACQNWLREFIRGQVIPALEPALAASPTRPLLVGAGGTAAVLARMVLALDSYDRDRLESARLSAETLSGWLERLWSLPLAERRTIPGLPPPRADVILTGAAIYEAIVRQLAFTEMRVSTRGLRFAAVMQLAGATGGAPGRLHDPNNPSDVAEVHRTGP